MAANLEIYDSTGTNVLDDLQNLGDLESGSESGVTSLVIKNIGSTTATNVRVFARALNGLYTGQDSPLGGEAITEKWLNAQVSGGGYSAIGGDFAGGSNPSPASNYITLSDIAAGASSGQIDFKLVIPSSVDTAGEFLLQFGVSYKP